MNASVLPQLSQTDVHQAAQLIQQAYSPSSVSADEQKRIQQQLFDVQKRPEAWGLVVPFLESRDPNVQFFGAHTAQVKIARDWDTFDHSRATELRHLLLGLTAHCAVAGHSKVILRKLYVALCTLALKLAPPSPTNRESQWPSWLVATITFFLGRSLSTETILDFCAIAAEEVGSADLLGQAQSHMQTTLMEASQLVTQAVMSSITTSSSSDARRRHAAFKCLEAWIPILPSSDLTPLIPTLISHLHPISQVPLEFDDNTFIGASDTLQEILSKSALSDGAGSKTLTEPLLLYLDVWGARIAKASVDSRFVDSVSHSLCKLLTALGDHSCSYFAANLTSIVPVSTPSGIVLRTNLVQSFLRTIMNYTGLPGSYGVDEEESEMTLGFWYLLQESLWSSDFDFDQEDDVAIAEQQQTVIWAIAKTVYKELVQILRQKVLWPEESSQWPKDQQEKFQVYRRDVGDTLINAFYVLRDDMLVYYIDDLQSRLARISDSVQWLEIEATLHCITSIQEAVPVEDNVQLQRLFSPEILGRLPVVGGHRVRRTMLVLIGTYASWFTTQSKFDESTLLMSTVSYVVQALREPSLCFHAANALRDLCDANRTALAPHISAFSDLHAGLAEIPDAEKCKVLQSIASVIQALPASEQLAPVEAIVSPVVQKLTAALQPGALASVRTAFTELPLTLSQLPDETRIMVILQLQTLTGVAKGLTWINESILDFEDTPETKARFEDTQNASADPRIVRVREVMLDGIRRTVELWSSDAGVADALSDLFKSATALQSDVTLLSLPPLPLLHLVCAAYEQQLSAVWLALASMLIVQLDPPLIFASPLKNQPSDEAKGMVLEVVSRLLEISLAAFSQLGYMEANPDIVQAFFSCMDTTAQHFVQNFYGLRPDLLAALMQCAINSLNLQERYSLVSASSFLSSLINRTATSDKLPEQKQWLVRTHGRPLLHAILSGFVGLAPRSATVNLIDLLSTFLMKYPAEARLWIREILLSDECPPSKAGPDAIDRFIRALAGRRTSRNEVKEAAQQFILVARGLDGTSFGYSTITM